MRGHCHASAYINRREEKETAFIHQKIKNVKRKALIKYTGRLKNTRMLCIGEGVLCSCSHGRRVEFERIVRVGLEERERANADEYRRERNDPSKHGRQAPEGT